MPERGEIERIRKLKELCEHLETLKKQAEEICKTATEELRKARRAGFRERRAVSRQKFRRR
jgi:hypothetical protein